MNDFYVYTYIRLDTGEPFYVGKGRKNRYKKKHNRNRYFLRIIQSIPYYIVFPFKNLSEKEAFAKETALIKLYKSRGYCKANLTDGGEGASGVFVTEERKKNISKAKKGKMFTNEHKVALSKSQANKPRPWRSKKVQCIDTEEIFETVREASNSIGINESALRRAIRANFTVRKTGYRYVYAK